MRKSGGSRQFAENLMQTRVNLRYPPPIVRLILSPYPWTLASG